MRVSPGEIAAVITHPRVRALSEDAQALYLELVQRADWSGHLAYDALDAAVDRRPRGDALEELAAADLVAREPDATGAWVRTPQSLDGRDVFDAARTKGTP